MAAVTLPSPPPRMPARLAGMDQPPRLTAYRFDLLGRMLSDSGQVINEAFIGYLDGGVSGSIKWDGYGTVKAGGSIELHDAGQNIDWLNTRIRPVALLQMPEGAETVEVPLGVVLPVAPVEKWTAMGRAWTVELLDKLSILDQDIYTDANGDATSYGLPGGSNVIAAVKALIESTGESSQAIEPGTKVLANPLVWETGTTKLRIITDLLQAADYFSLDTDGAGNYRTGPYIEPSRRTPIYTRKSPFGEGSIASPEWTLDHDIFSIPNRFVAIGQGDGDTPALVATVENLDPESPFSYPSRGRWITLVDTGIEATDIDSLMSYARRRMTQATSTAMDFSVKHLYMPDLRIGSVIRFSEAGLDTLAVVRTTDLAFDPLALCSTLLRRVA